MYAERLVEAASICYTSYCVAMKLSTLVTSLAEVAGYAGWDAGEALREVLMSAKVVSAACSWPLSGLPEEVWRPQFRVLRPYAAVLAEWLHVVRQSCGQGTGSTRRPRAGPAAAQRQPTHAAPAHPLPRLVAQHPAARRPPASAAGHHAGRSRGSGGGDWAAALFIAGGLALALLVLLALFLA